MTFFCLWYFLRDCLSPSWVAVSILFCSFRFLRNRTKIIFTDNQLGIAYFLFSFFACLVFLVYYADYTFQKIVLAKIIVEGLGNLFMGVLGCLLCDFILLSLGFLVTIKTVILLKWCIVAYEICTRGSVENWVELQR